MYSNVKFKFNPPNAPHMGRAWERLVRSVKVGLQRTINSQILREDTLRATLFEIEMVINSRPLTNVQTDENVQEALTLNHFLLGHSSLSKPVLSTKEGMEAAATISSTLLAKVDE